MNFTQDTRSATTELQDTHLTARGFVKRLALVLIAALALGACGGKATTTTAHKAAAQTKAFVAPKPEPTTVAPTTTTPAPVAPSDAKAIATKLGCVTSESSPSTPFPPFPTPTQDVTCTVQGVDLEVTVYASHADVAKYNDPGLRLVFCALVTGFGETGPFYWVTGDDFTVEASTHAAPGEITVGTLAQAQALGVALGLPVTTITCPAVTP